jgi:hypothetical protein
MVVQKNTINRGFDTLSVAAPILRRPKVPKFAF